MSKLDEIEKEVGIGRIKDGPQKDGSILVGHENVMRKLSTQIAKEKDMGIIREKLEWVAENTLPKGIDFGDWWIRKMEQDLK